MALIAGLLSTARIIALRRWSIKGCTRLSKRRFCSRSANTIRATDCRSISPSTPITPAPHHFRSCSLTAASCRTARFCSSELITRHPADANSAATCDLPAPIPPQTPIVGFLLCLLTLSESHQGCSWADKPVNPPFAAKEGRRPGQATRGGVHQLPRMVRLVTHSARVVNPAPSGKVETTSLFGGCWCSRPGWHQWSHYDSSHTRTNRQDRTRRP